MRRLILIRHAKSDWSFAGLNDHDRPLNNRGLRAATKLGDWLRAKEYLPEEVLCSSAKRTGETLLGLDLTPAPQTRFTRSLYLAEAEAMLNALRQATAPCVLMLGHNPGIADFACRLLATLPSHPRFADYPTGATLVCDFATHDWNEIGWRQGQPISFVIPRELD